jgi:hypothetical protein
MTERRSRLRVRFYPSHGTWTCIVQRVDAEGMPMEDVLSAAGDSRDAARAAALSATEDPDVREAIEASVH